MALPAGTQLGRYTVLKPLASDGMTDVLLARAEGMAGFQHHVVIKTIRATRSTPARVIQMFVDEARLAASLHHHHIVQVHDVGHDANDYFFAMEYVHGENLRKLLANVASAHELVPLEQVITIGAAVAAGLHHAHQQNIVHRDVTPANILVGYDGNVKVTDFGIAKALLQSSELTKSGAMRGKVAYMSPEQCLGHAVDRRSDVFALGIVLYELCTSRRLFKGDNDFLVMSAIVNAKIPRPTLHRTDLPPELEDIILKALAPKPELRFETAEDLAIALEGVAASNGLRISAMALAEYMRQRFGTRGEPWLVEDRLEEVDVDFDGAGTGLVQLEESEVRPPILPPLAGTDDDFADEPRTEIQDPDEEEAPTLTGDMKPPTSGFEANERTLIDEEIDRDVLVQARRGPAPAVPAAAVPRAASPLDAPPRRDATPVPHVDSPSRRHATPVPQHEAPAQPAAPLHLDAPPRRDATPVPHADSPSRRHAIPGAPQPRRDATPVPHADAPSRRHATPVPQHEAPAQPAAPLHLDAPPRRDATPVPHADSPSRRHAIPGAPQPRRDATPVPHADSPSRRHAIPGPQADAPAPLHLEAPPRRDATPVPRADPGDDDELLSFSSEDAATTVSRGDAATTVVSDTSPLSRDDAATTVVSDTSPLSPDDAATTATSEISPARDDAATTATSEISLSRDDAATTATSEISPLSRDDTATTAVSAAPSVSRRYATPIPRAPTPTPSPRAHTPSPHRDATPIPRAATPFPHRAATPIPHRAPTPFPGVPVDPSMAATWGLPGGAVTGTPMAWVSQDGEVPSLAPRGRRAMLIAAVAIPLVAIGVFLISRSGGGGSGSTAVAPATTVAPDAFVAPAEPDASSVAPAVAVDARAEAPLDAAPAAPTPAIDAGAPSAAKPSGAAPVGTKPKPKPKPAGTKPRPPVKRWPAKKPPVRKPPLRR